MCIALADVLSCWTRARLHEDGIEGSHIGLLICSLVRRGPRKGWWNSDGRSRMNEGCCMAPLG